MLVGLAPERGDLVGRQLCQLMVRGPCQKGPTNPRDLRRGTCDAGPATRDLRRSTKEEKRLNLVDEGVDGRPRVDDVDERSAGGRKPSNIFSHQNRRT
jgi:hypothetical protein